VAAKIFWCDLVGLGRIQLDGVWGVAVGALDGRGYISLLDGKKLFTVLRVMRRLTGMRREFGVQASACSGARKTFDTS
jgi:hypothetical protein